MVGIRYFQIALLCLSFSFSVCADEFKAKLIGNYDGDTFKVNLNGLPKVFGKEIPVRIRGIDAPELNDTGRCGSRLAGIAKCVLKSMLEKNPKKIELKNVDRDKYFRLLADVYVNKTNIAEALLELDVVVPYDGKTKPTIDWCAQLIKALSHESAIACR